MRIHFYGGAGSVTGSSYLLEMSSARILVDCGMFQGNKELRERNALDFQFAPKDLNAVLITHGHIDHIGLLPKLVNAGYRGPIYATEATLELMEVLLYDSAHIQESDAEWENRKLARIGKAKIIPLYKEADVEETVKLFKKVSLHAEFMPVPDVKVKYKDAGHILGSSFIELKIKEKGIEKIFIFSGDVGRKNQSIIRDTEESDTAADVVFIESTYGNRLHKTGENTEKELIDILNEISRIKGTLIIPAFALGRTQEMIYKFFELFDKHKIPEIKIYVDSPMANKVTEIYSKNQDLYDEDMINYYKDGKNPLFYPELVFIADRNESMKLNNTPGPKVIISASGMCDAGRIRHHLKHNIWKSDAHVLFVGYQGEGTLGRRLIEGAKRVNILGEQISVKAKIHTVGGLSAHADRGELLTFLKMFKNSKPEVFIVHGEAEPAKQFGELIKKELGYKTTIPSWNDVDDIKFFDDRVEIKSNKSEGFYIKADEYSNWKALVKKVEDHVYALDKSKTEDKRIAKEMFLKRVNSLIEESLEENNFK